MTNTEKIDFLKSKGWYTWYHENYWVHPKTVEDPSRQDHTNYGMSLDDAIKYEEEGCPPHKSVLWILNYL